MQNLYVTPEQMRVARPDTISDITQLATGRIVIRFSTYFDGDGIINRHLSRTAVVQGAPCRIIKDEVVDRGVGKYLQVERLPANTLEEQSLDPTFLSVGSIGIAGVDKLSPRLTIGTGLLAVREEMSSEGTDLEVGQGLYVDGTNSLDALFHQNYMAIALDSDPRLQGQLPQSWR